MIVLATRAAHTVVLSALGFACASGIFAADGQSMPNGAHVMTVHIDHDQPNMQTPFGVIGINEGDLLEIRLENTKPECFTYNSVPVTPPVVPDHKGATGETRTAVVVFVIVHDGVASGYKIVAAKKEGALNCSGTSLAPFEHIVPVKTYGWQLAATGAFTVDKLVSPVFALKPATQDGKPGFVVTQDTGQSNSANLGLAAMLSIYYDHPTTLCIGRQAFCWVPISFGLGIDSSSQAKYFFGTSGRLGTKMFVTCGYALGQVSRLPNGVTVGSFTENANALSSLPTKTGGAFFAALSYSFATVSVDRFSKMFKEPTPVQTATPKK